MLSLIDLVYYSHNEFDSPEQVLKKHAPSLCYIDYLKDKINVEVIRHMNKETSITKNNVVYRFFKRKNNSWQIPFQTHRYIRKKKSDIILTHGLIFPLQVIFLKMAVGKKTKIIVQHHGERVVHSKRKLLQRIADKYVDGYLFTSKEIAQPWIESKIIANQNKVFEVLEAGIEMPVLDKPDCKTKLGIQGDHHFLWVGRLNENKDPITIIKSFQQFLLQQPEAKLYLIYQQADLLPEIQTLINNDKRLHAAIKLIGAQTKDQLAEWYHACDFFILGSHHEGSGYALLEAMHCGCIPVVTNIASFRKITAAGKYGFLFEPGNINECVNKLLLTGTIDQGNLSEEIRNYAKTNLGFKNIATDILSVCNKLLSI